ncbi:MAG: transketolase family protein [Chloroflexota bacterium]
MATTQTQATKSTREGFGEALLELGRDNPNIVALTADTYTLSCIDKFGKEFPGRVFDIGIAEQNLIGMAAGLASCGLIPFATSYAPFLTTRSLEQIRDDTAYTKFKVRVVAVAGGVAISVGGSTHHAIDDLAITRAIPNLTVIVPADAIEAYKLTKLMVDVDGPVYFRLGGRAPEPLLNVGDYPVEIGRAAQLRDGNDLTIIACGTLVASALKAAEQLATEGVQARVLNMHTIKPLDREAIVKAAKETGRIVTAEEHNVLGGLGSAVAEVVSTAHPVPIRMLGIKDVFVTIGPLGALYERYNLTPAGVLATAREVLDA